MTVSHLTHYALLGSIGIVAAVVFGLRRALINADWGAYRRRVTIATTASTLVAWLVATSVLAWLGAYGGTPDRIPTIQFGVLVPILIGGWLIWRSPAVSRVIDAVPQSWLVGVQLYRVLGGVFVALFAAGSLPGLFALPAGLGDLAVGLLAPVVALACAKRPREGAASVLAWNIFGLADLAVALATGVATAPSPVQLAALDHPNTLISAFPLVLIPVFLVPVSVVLHIASLTKLHRTAAHAAGPPDAAVSHA